MFKTSFFFSYVGIQNGGESVPYFITQTMFLVALRGTIGFFFFGVSLFIGKVFVLFYKGRPDIWVKTLG